MFFKQKTQKNNKQQDSWDSPETVNWSNTEGYEEVRQVNNGLRWPSVWADRKARAIRDKAVKQTSPAVNHKVIDDKEPLEVKKQVIAPVVKQVSEVVKVAEVIKPVSHKIVSKQHDQSNGFWQQLFAGHPKSRARRFNKTRSRQIKQKSGGLSLGAAQVSLASFQAKEERRHQLVEARRAAQPAPALKQPEKQISAVPPKPQPQPQPVETSQGKDNHQQRLQDLKQRFEQKAWNRPSLTETNLVDSRATLYFNWNKFWLTLTQWLVVTLFFLALCGALLYLWQQRQNKQATDVTQRFTKIDQLINLTENEVSGVLDFRLRLIMVNEMLSKHIYWNNFFSFLEKNTLPNVSYQDFSGDTKGDYILRAKTDSFDSMAKQIKVFRLSPDVVEVSSEGGEMVKNESTADASSTEEIITGSQLNFSIRLKIKPDLFSR